MDSNIQDIYEELLKDPDLFDSIVQENHKNNPTASIEEIHIEILKLISKQYYEEADQEKIRRQLDITRDRIVSKTLDNLPDSDLTSNKSKIRHSLLSVSNSGTGHEREEIADILKDFADTHEKRLKKRKKASGDISRMK